MKKLALAAVSALVATALTGAAVVRASGGTTVHTKRFVSHPRDFSNLARNTFGGTDVDRHAGHTVGYDGWLRRVHHKTLVVSQESFALKDGTITVVLRGKNGGSRAAGQIVNGTGKYKGINGTVAARKSYTHLTFTYHF